jgi:DNA-binding transcriptional MerR regulator
MALEQLNLFGFEEQAPKPNKKAKTKPIAASPVEGSATTVLEDNHLLANSLVTEPHQVSNVSSIAEPQAPALESEPPKPVATTKTTLNTSTEEQPEHTAPIVFNDGTIGIKLKLKLPTPPKEPLVNAVTVSPVLTEIKKIVGKRGRKSHREIDAALDMVQLPHEDILKQKLYWGISEVAKWFSINTSLLRYWEKEFALLKPRKTRKGDRLFTYEDIKNLQVIYFLLRNKKFSIEAAREYLKANRAKADVQAEITHSLTKIRGFITELKANLNIE